MAERIDDILKAARDIQASPAGMVVSAITDVDVLYRLFTEIFGGDSDFIRHLEESKQLAMTQLEALVKISDSMDKLSTLPVQLLSLEELLNELNNKIGRMLHLQEFGTVRILETRGVTIAAGRKFDLFRGYNEAGRIQSVLLDLNSEEVEGYLSIDKGRIEFAYAKLKELYSFEPSGRDWWISRHDDTEGRYVLQLTPVEPLPFDKQLWVRIWNKAGTDITLNVGRVVKQSKPVDIADLKAEEYGTDVQIARSTRLRKELALKSKQDEIKHAEEVFK